MTRNAAKLLLGLTVLTALVLAASPAMADVVSYTIDLGNHADPGLCGGGSGAPSNCTGSTTAPPYATVGLTLNADKSITLTVTPTNGYQLKENGNFFGFNYSGGSALTFAGAKVGKPNGNLSDFGEFDYVLNSISSNGSFTVSRAGGFTSATELAQANDYGYLFAMHVYKGSITGWAGTNTTPAPTPEPATLALLGTGLVALGGFARRFRK